MILCELIESWVRARGLAVSPRLSIGDGALGFWPAFDEVYPETKRQRAGCIRLQIFWISFLKVYDRKQNL